jgi:hypothetical protein
MVHEIPVFFLPTSVHALGEDPETQAETLIADSRPRPDGDYVEDTSTYWWRSELALELAAAWAIPGLAFLGDVVALLSPAQALRAADAAEEVLRSLESQPIPTLGRAFGPELEALASADIKAVRAMARPAWQGDVGGDDAVTFVEFLLAVAVVARTAAAGGKQLLFYRPQP